MVATARQALAASVLLVPLSAAHGQQTKADQSPPQSLTTEQEIKSGQNACEATNGRPLPANCAPANTAAITVTGSRIRRPNLDSPVPVTSVGGQEFFQTGNVSVGDKLAELPSIRGTFTQANSTRFLGTAGLNLLDLRGLGTSRTLVLVNGRRHVGGDVLNSGTSTDVNTIPTDLIDRVDVVTGGDSAVYGSDAIAGVVNFVLKDHYQGLQVRGQGGLSKYGDAGSYFVSVLAGQNFAGGRGNVAVNAEYAQQNQFFASSRPWLARTSAFITVDTDPAGTPNGSDGIPDRLLFRNVLSGSISNDGMMRFGGTSAFNCGRDPTGGFYPCVFLFTPQGTLIPETGVRVGNSPGSFIGGNGDNLRTGREFQLQPNLKRYNLNLIGHFEISPALVPFVEGTFSRTDASGTGSSGPAFIQGSTLDGDRERIRIDNPFLTDQARTVICQERTLAGQTCNPTDQVPLRENLLGLGARIENSRRDTYRIVGGIRGDFLDSWNYEVSLNYGRMDESTAILGNLDIQRFLLGMDAAVNPATGQIQCRSQFDPAAQFGIGIDESLAPGSHLSTDIAQCVPVNPLGGQFSQAVRNYVLRNTVAKGRTTQFDALAFVSGDTGKFFNLWGGPIGFSIGAEHREDGLLYEQDPNVAAGYTFYNALGTLKAPKNKVSEAFGEIRLPILKDKPFFNDLEASVAARVSHYTLGTTGTVWAYNGNVIWAPVRGLRFRGNYSRSVRAPNQSELFFPLSQNFAPGFSDPCSSENIGAGSPNRAANCAAAGRPGGSDSSLNPSHPGVPAPNPAGPYDFRYDESLQIRSGGNAKLQAEKSDSWTLGFVATPAFIQGLSLTVDYYNIKVNNVIASVSAQDIVNNCYDLAAGNSFCNLFQRVPSGQTGPAGEQTFRIIEGSLIQGPVNFAKRTAKGVDFEVAYRHGLGGFGRIDTSLRYTRVFDRSNFEDPTQSNFRNVIVGKNGGELGDPRDQFNWNTQIQHGRFTFGYQMRYVGKQYIDAYEDYNTVQGRPPQNADFAEFEFYPARLYHDVRMGIDVGPKYNFYLGVDNLTNATPPLNLTGIGDDSKYDNRGRFYYAGVVAKF